MTKDTLNIAALKALFEKNADVQFQEYTFNDYKVHIISCDQMVDIQMLNEVVIRRVKEVCSEIDGIDIETELLKKLHIPDLQKVDDQETLIKKVFKGSVLLYFEEQNFLLSSNLSNQPNRNPEESRMEMIVKGSRDNFIEDVAVNIALIRKRAPTNSLAVEKFELGKRTKTTVAVLYFDDIASKEILHEIKRQLENIDIDIVFSGELLMEKINKFAPILPRNDYTGRADYALQALIRGRFIILIDGVSYAVITPVNLFLLLKSGEDVEYPVVFSSLERLLRIAGLMIGLLLPAFWLALTTFHQNQLPFQLLATVVQTNTGTPFPSVLEMLLMLFMFELFREAGLRLPSVLGGTISVVGGLIIGDAAIRSGITSPAMIVVIAISTISTFTLVNQSLVTSISILRVIFIIVTSVLGLFGFFLELYFTLLCIAKVRIFGVPYFNITADLSWATIKKSLFRMKPSQYRERPRALDPQDRTRTGADYDS